MVIKTIFVLCCRFCLNTFAQVDSGETNEPPDNETSEFVPGLSASFPGYGGNGCPLGSLSAVLSFDQRTLSVLFDRYTSEVGGSTGLRTHTAACVLQMDFSVPSGFQVAIVRADYRGFMSIPWRARSTFGAGVRFVELGGEDPNRRRELVTKQFRGPIDKDFRLHSYMRGAAWSPCGKSFLLALESELMTETNNSNETVMGMIDSADVSAPLQVHLKWRKCNIPRQ